MQSSLDLYGSHVPREVRVYQKHAKRYLEFNVKYNEVLGLEMVFGFLFICFNLYEGIMGHQKGFMGHRTIFSRTVPHCWKFSIPGPLSFGACSMGPPRKASTFPEHT